MPRHAGGEPLRIGGHRVAVSRPDKVLFPDGGVTKGELVEYYRRIAPWILPHLRDRAIALERYPEGIGAPGFFQKATPAYYPEWIRRVTIPKREGGTVEQVVCDDAATLVYLANQDCITPHIWLSRTDRLDYPDRMLFDLDPGDGGFEPARAAAQAVKALLDELGLPAYLKTTGSRGLHVAVPLKRREGFDSVRAFARALASVVVSRDPDRWTVEQRKAPRRGRLFVDTNRNAYAQLIAPAYAVRARPGAPVAVPLSWEELRRPELRSNGVTIRTVFDRLASVADPWADFRRSGASLARARQRFERLYGGNRKR
jgi:bifunctional non-homologous end joining protein LigD